MIFSIAALAIVGGGSYIGAKVLRDSHIDAWLKQRHTAIKKFKHEKIDPLLGQKRRQQLKEMAAGETRRQPDDVERKIDQNLNLALISFGLTTTSIFTLPVVSLASIPLLAYTSIDFLKGGYKSLVEERKVGMAVVDAIALPGMVLTGHFFLASIAYSFYYLSRKLSRKVRGYSEKNLANIFSQQPRVVWVERHGVEIQLPFEALKRGDIVVVEAGESILADGVVVSGYASVDQHMLTGESIPLEREAGDQVFAATLVLSGKIRIQVEQAGQDTISAQIREMLAHTATYKPTVQLRGEQLADKSALPLLAASALTLPLLGIQSALTILQAGFGYTMRVIAPISTMNFLNIASHQGILIKDGSVLESFSKVDTIVFDKTGTLTLEQLHIARISPCPGYTEDTLLAYAAAAETKQAHPLAQAIVRAARERTLRLPTVTQASYEIGYGIKVYLDQQVIRVGSKRFMELEGIALPPEVGAGQTDPDAQGSLLVYVGIEDQLGGVIELQATIRPEAKYVINELHRRNFAVAIISGDHENPTRKLAQELGIEAYFANTLPENKANLIRKMRHEGKFVCFIGDGINDSIALEEADVSISLRGAATIATDTAQIIFMDQSLEQLLHMLDLTEDFEANMKTNTLATIIPGVICIGGIFFLNFGILVGCILFDLGLSVGLVNSMLPLLQQQWKEEKPQLAAPAQASGATHSGAVHDVVIREGHTPAHELPPMLDAAAFVMLG